MQSSLSWKFPGVLVALLKRATFHSCFYPASLITSFWNRISKYLKRHIEWWSFRDNLNKTTVLMEIAFSLKTFHQKTSVNTENNSSMNSLLNIAWKKHINTRYSSTDLMKTSEFILFVIYRAAPRRYMHRFKLSYIAKKTNSVLQFIHLLLLKSKCLNFATNIIL